MSFSSISVLTACLLLIGVSVMILVNIQNLVKDVENQNVVVAFVKEGISDEEVIASTSGIDLLLGGHTHTLMNEPRIYLNENGKDVPAMHTGRNGAHIGKIEITIN